MSDANADWSFADILSDTFGTAGVPYPVVYIPADDPVRGWRSRMLGLHGGLARSVPAYRD